MKDEAVIKKVFTKSALIGAGLAVFCGLLLWGTPAGNGWENASYDLLFHFGNHTATNQVALVLLDNDSFDALHQDRGHLWDRNLHAQLLAKLTGDGARLVIFDILFKNTNNPATDAKLAGAIRQNGHVILMADVTDRTQSSLATASVIQPAELFLKSAAGFGVGHVDAETGGIARHHWPFYAPGEGEIHSLGWAAAVARGAQLDSSLGQQWLRYYGREGPGTRVSYYHALREPAGFFRGKVVFIGSWPDKPDDAGLNENDKFRTPYTWSTGKAVGGVEVMATTFANLMNGDWLRRPPAWIEIGLLVLTGVLTGGGLCRLKPLPCLAAAVGFSLAVMLIFVAWSYFSNHWFPWLMIAGGQVPVALAWAWISQSRTVTVFQERYPGYTPVGEPFGAGAYGKVLRVRNVTGQFEALKEVERATFSHEGPYDREFRGIKSYKPVSHQHPGLLNIFFVNCNEAEGYFYYVMELGDALDPDWEQKGELYQPRDLDRVCRLEPGALLPVRECIRIGIALLEALEFLHEHNLVHRDIKPSNIIFVNGRPKLADVGLVRAASPESTNVGTLGYMPPAPEPPGSKMADIYAMGMVLYVISTGSQPAFFARLSTEQAEQPDFMLLNEIICTACQPVASHRYPSVSAMRAALRAVQNELEAGETRRM